MSSPVFHHNDQTGQLGELQRPPGTLLPEASPSFKLGWQRGPGGQGWLHPMRPSPTHLAELRYVQPASLPAGPRAGMTGSGTPGAGTPVPAATTYTRARFRALLASCCGSWTTAGGCSLRRSGPHFGGERGPRATRDPGSLAVGSVGRAALQGSGHHARGSPSVQFCQPPCAGGGRTGLGLCPQSALCPPDPRSWRHRTGKPGPGPLTSHQCPRSD